MGYQELIAERTETCRAIAWDGCHKIYVLMDDEQVELMKSYGYEYLTEADSSTPDQMAELIDEWIEDSCSLVFVSAVTTNHLDPNLGFEDLLPQFALHEE